jgi:hypothetical protein
MSDELRFCWSKISSIKSDIFADDFACQSGVVSIRLTTYLHKANNQ